MDRIRLGTWLWIGCLQYFAAEAIAIQGWPGRYSLSRNFISDLGALHCAPGAICSPLHAWMNGAFVLQGVLIVSGTLLLRPSFPRGMLWSLALALIGGSGAGAFLVGLAPEDAFPALHYAGAVENFVACNLGMALIGVAMLLRRSGPKRLGAISLAAGALGLTAIALLAAGVDLGLGAGGVERSAAYPFPLWLAGLGALSLTRTERRI